MTQQEVYEMFAQHHEHAAAWHNKVLIDTLESLYADGFVEPRLIVLYYDYQGKEYGTTIIHLSRERMIDPETAREDYQLMQLIDKKIQYSVIATVFISEGTTEVENSTERLNFIMIAFESHVRGWKNLYRIKKTSLVNPDGSTNIQVDEIEHDLEASESHHIPLVEKYAHILRPNVYDKLQAVIYN